MDQTTLSNTYSRYAKWYDYTFGAIIQPGRRKVIEKLQCKSGDKILEVGVGTGLSLPLYPENVEITGIDLSTDMLNIAQKRVDELKLTNVVLTQMNAELMTFEDNSFDRVVALYVASVVPNPDKLVAEMERVCKPGGELFIVNHFYNTHPVWGSMERFLSPLLTKMFGFQPCVRLDEFIEKTGIEIDEQHKVNAMGNWTFLRIKNRKQSHDVTNKILTNESNDSEASVVQTSFMDSSNHTHFSHSPMN